MHVPTRRRLLTAFRPWSSAIDDPRLRRPTDILLLVVSGLVTVSIGLGLRSDPPATTPPSGTAPTISDVASWVADTVYALVAIWAVVLLLLPVFSPGRRRLLLDYLLGCGLAVFVGLLVSRPTGESWTDTLHSILTTDPQPVDVVGPLAMATAVVVIASPHITRPLRWTGRLLILVGAAAAVVLDVTHPMGGITVIAVGIMAAAITHLVLGTPSGHPTADQVAVSLPDVGLDVDDLVGATRQPPGASRFLATGEDGRPLVIKVYGRDSWDDQLVGSVWTALTIRGESVDMFGGRRRRVEHEALVTLLAEREGAPVAAGGHRRGRRQRRRRDRHHRTDHRARRPHARAVTPATSPSCGPASPRCTPPTSRTEASTASPSYAGTTGPGPSPTSTTRGSRPTPARS